MVGKPYLGPIIEGLPVILSQSES